MRKQWNRTDTDIIRIVHNCAAVWPSHKPHQAITFQKHFTSALIHWWWQRWPTEGSSLFNRNDADALPFILFQLVYFEKMAPMRTVMTIVFLQQFECSIDKLRICSHLICFKCVFATTWGWHSCTDDIVEMPILLRP